jgi:hypothetical protein
MKQYSPLHVLPRNQARPRLGRRAATAAAGALLCALAGCVSAPAEPGEPIEPGEPRKVRTSFRVEASDSTQYGVFLSLDEDPAQRGKLTGTLAVSGEVYLLWRGVEIALAEATMEGSTLRLAPGALPDTGTLYFSWDILDIRLEDEDGDGVMESGTGMISGAALSPGSFQDIFTAAPDGYPVVARAYRKTAGAADHMLPWEALAVTLEQPVSNDQIERYRVLADGQEVAGELAFVGSEGLHTSFTFTPDDFLPMGATIEVDLGGVENVVGVPVVLEQDETQVMADPGALSINPGFEQALAGWYASGDAVVMASAGDLVPVEGTGMAALRTALTERQHSLSRLFGYLDVPVDATALDLSLALLAPEEALPTRVAMRLHHVRADGGHEEIEVYEFDHEAAVFEPCDCGELGASPPLTRRAGPLRHEIDLSALRGQRVFLEIELHGEPWSGPRLRAVAPIPPPPPPIPSVVLVDDLQIR